MQRGDGAPLLELEDDVLEEEVVSPPDDELEDEELELLELELLEDELDEVVPEDDDPAPPAPVEKQGGFHSLQSPSGRQTR